MHISDQTMTEFFYQNFRTECRKIELKLDEKSQHYVVNLAVRYAHSDQLFMQEGDGKSLPTLAFLYRDALAASSKRERNGLIQTLGDTALFLAAFFPTVWQRRGLNRSYFIAMSESAFSYLALLETTNDSPFAELAEKNEPVATCLGKTLNR